MNLSAELFSSAYLWLAGGIFLIVIWRAAKNITWHLFLQNSFSHLFLGSCVFIFSMWNISTSMLPGLNYHYLGAMLLTLMFRWQIAFLLVCVVFLLFAASGKIDWFIIPVFALTKGFLPVLIAHYWYRTAEKILPNHFFIYVFINGFFGAAIVMLVSILAVVAVTVTNGIYSIEKINYEFFPFLPLMLFPEAFITGTLITLMVVFKPNWVETFDDVKYLHKY